MRALYFSKLPKSFIVILFILLFSITTFAQSDDSLYYTNPNYHVAKELFNKRIVMLGDETHHTTDMYYSVINVLNEWLNIVRENDIDSQYLTLILETCPESAKIINEYINDGNIEPLLNLILPETEFYFEDIEYYVNLRNFYLNIEKINQVRTNKINFEIRGFEVSPYGCFKESDEGFKSTIHERELWFVNQRDSITASGIIDYTNKKPDNKFLIFYGSAHLLKGFTRKPTTSLSDSESSGFFLSTYLKNEYGDKNVITVRQKDLLTSEFYDDNGIKIFRGNNIIIPTKNLKISGWQPEYFDFMILRYIPYRYIQPHKVNFTFSRRLLEKFTEEGSRMKSLFPLEEAKSYYNAELFFINFIIGNNFSNIEEVQEWMKNNNYDGIEKIESPEFARKLFNIYYVSKKKSFLNQIGFEGKITDSTFNPDTNYWKETYWPEQKKRVKFMNCIGIYWIGYPDEKIKAKEYLKEFSGEDFVEPEKYLQWYRKKYYGVEY